MDALLIAGPTASGKTALAVALAGQMDAEVINADSMQVYRDLNILSARPQPAEQAGLPHHLFGHVEAGTEYNVGRYVREAGALLASLTGGGRRVVIVGGTGLFFRALTHGLAETPDIPVDLMAEVNALPVDALHARLALADPAAAARLHPTDAPRMQRALAVKLATGRTLLDWQQQAPSRPALAGLRWRGLFLAPPPEVIYARIDRRFHAMVAAGALAEVAALRARNLPANRGIMKAHGMPHLVAHLDGALTLEEAVSRSQQDTRHYARRQRTWARRFMADWTWLQA